MARTAEKSNVVVAFVYDFETGGLDCTRCGATQISLHAVRLDTFEVIGKYQSYIYPYYKKPEIGKPKKKVLRTKYEIEDESQGELMDYEKTALDISGVTMDMLYSMGKELSVVCQEICDFISANTFPVVASNKPFMVGQNPLFDKGFMQQIMLYSGMWESFCKLVRGAKDFWGNFQPAQLDTIVLAQLALDDDKSINNWKLESISERLGIDLDDAHDADADVTATRDVMRVLTARMRNSADNPGLLSEEKKEKTRAYFKI